MRNYKKILIITSEFPPQPGGIGTHASHLASALTKAGHEVSVITDQRSVSGNEEAKFDAKCAFVITRIPIKKLRIMMYLQRIIKTYQKIKHADMVIASGKFALWNVALTSLFRKRSTLAVIHGSEVNLKNKSLKRLTDWSLSQIDQIVAVSQFTKQLVSHLHKEVVVIPNGIIMDDWQDTHNAAVCLSGNPVLITVGRVSERKGQGNVINLMPEILKTHPELQYHCVGIDTEAPKYIALAKQLGVDKQVQFHGAVDFLTLKQMLKGSDIFVMLSTQSIMGDVEGFGIAILEANALGIPAIGARGCGIEEAIVDSKTGYVIEANNTGAFINSVQMLLSYKETFAQQAYKWAQKHDWCKLVKHYEALIR